MTHDFSKDYPDLFNEILFESEAGAQQVLDHFHPGKFRVQVVNSRGDTTITTNDGIVYHIPPQPDSCHENYERAMRILDI